MGEQELEERARSESRASPLPPDINSESEQSPIKSLKDGSGALSLSPGGERFWILEKYLTFLIGSRDTSNQECI